MSTNDTDVILEVEDENIYGQLWKIGVPNNEGYFALESAGKRDKVLTVISSSSSEIKGNLTIRSRTTMIYLDGRVLRPIIKPRPSFGYFSTVICLSKI